MSDKRDSGEERGLLAAEYALGVLEGEELDRARALAESETHFRQEVARWSARLSPLLDEVDATEPPASGWRRIEVALFGSKPGAAANDNVIRLRRHVRVWRAVSAGAFAAAAALALVLIMRPPVQSPAPPLPAPSAPKAAPMLAMLGDEDTPVKMVASWNPAERRLTVASPAPSAAEPGKSHELWVIPTDGTPRSLGVMPSGEMMRMSVEGGMAQQLSEGVTLAVSVEPEGGSPTGLPTGPVIASGKLRRA